jgi:hypothetical protein
VTINLRGLQFLPANYHVHKFPPSQGCATASYGTHYNPDNVPWPYPSQSCRLVPGILPKIRKSWPKSGPNLRTSAYTQPRMARTITPTAL